MEQINSRLQESWLCQLVREYSGICYQYRVRLAPPILTISNDKKRLGCWSATDRSLSLSHFLIAAHPWNLTLQVLKHEMAHQICSELYHREDAGHGPLFRQACTLLGLDAPFHRASADLAEEIDTMPAASEATEQGRQIIDKVRKLLALGSSDNEHEAALAVQRAGELLDRHRLDFAALAEDQGLVHRTINTGQQTLPVHRKSICSLLESCFAVRVICSSLYQPHEDVSFKTIELLGREEQVAIAEHCYHFLENRLQTLWQKNRAGFGGNGRIAKKSYYLGLLAGFRQTLERSRTASPAPTEKWSPARIFPVIREAQQLLKEAEQLDDFVATRYPRLRRLRRQGGSIYRSAYQEAVAAGRTITLHQPMDGGKKREIRLLS